MSRGNKGAMRWSPELKPRRGMNQVGSPRRARIKRHLLEKYGPICQLCRGPIDMTITGIHDPMRWSVDHIISIKNGGTNAMTNLQPMHAKCNNEKG